MTFKTCGCGVEWRTRDAFMSDPSVSVVGYQVDFTHLQEGLFLFNHHMGECQTTFSFPAWMFLDLHEGPIFKERQTGSKECLGYCLHRDILKPCPAQCECAFVRDVLDKVARWPKRPAA